MPKRNDIKKILVIGSGPIVIGQACEFDYSGTQALKALKEDGYKVVLVNSNPATIMTDPEFSHKVYIEPLTCEFLEKIIKKEKPDALLPTLGGQTALNLAVELYRQGILKKYGVEMIGARYESIQKGEDRLLFKKAIENIGLENPKSGYAKNLEEAKEIVKSIGFPNIIRPSFTLGGRGGSICISKDEFDEKVKWGLSVSPVKKILIEESLVGWKEYELEVMRDKNDNVVIICPIENFDPMGVHTGDSITVAPAQTLTDKEYQKLRDASIKIMREIGVDTGGSNIQFAVNPKDGRIVVIEMNPRVSRSSALASKATGFPIAKIAAKLAVGYTLDEIKNDITKKTPASFEPTIDYVVVKVPRFTFEKFHNADQTLNTSMKSVGEVMAIGRNFKEALQKAIRGLEIGRYGLGADGKGRVKVAGRSLPANGLVAGEKGEGHSEELKHKLTVPNCERIFDIKYALQLGLTVEEISELSKIDKWFVYQIKEIVDLENQLRKCKVLSAKCKVKTKDLMPFTFHLPPSTALIRKAKQYGFSDYQIGYLTGQSEVEIRELREKVGIKPTYKTIDTCAGEFEAYTPYFYSTYEEEDESIAIKQLGKVNTTQLHPARRDTIPQSHKVMILGGGPNRIGQGIEFDYCCVQAVFALKKAGYETIMVNCNPETVSTDYDICDKLYFEPLTYEDVMNIIEKEKPIGVIVQFGGQTPLNLSRKLKNAGVKIIGTSCESIDLAEDRKKFAFLLKKLKIPLPSWGCVKNLNEAKKISRKIGYPVIVRPSYVLGGRAMEVVYDEQSLEKYASMAINVSDEHPIFIDKFLQGAQEVDVDAVSDGKDTYIAGILEHIEEAGIHSGDSACKIPPVTLSKQIIQTITNHTKKLAIKLKVKGLMNIQFAIKNGVVYVLEVNPRASRTVPFVSKATGVPVVKLAIDAMLGNLQFPSPFSLLPSPLKYIAVKESVLPFNRFTGVDTVLGPEMRSTGEVMGIDTSYPLAFAKSQISAGTPLPTKGKIFISVNYADKRQILPLVAELKKMKFEVIATDGTAEFLSSKNIKVKCVKKVSEGSSEIIGLIKSRKIALIINTPTGKRSALSDGYLIRTNALFHSVPVITTLSAAYSALEAIKLLRKKEMKIKSMQEYYSGSGV